MNTNWLENDKLFSEMIKHLKEAEVVLDIGCGIMPQPYITPSVHICCEPFDQYVEALQNRLKDESNVKYLILHSTWDEAVRLFPPESVDTVFLVDVIEHLDKEEGRRLLKATEKIARQQIVLFTTLGFMPQKHLDGKDAWGLNGAEWQEHKSGWLPDDFDNSWLIFASEGFHETDNLGNRLEKPFGAFWAIRDLQREDASHIQKYINAPKSVWLQYQALQQEYQGLQQEYQRLQQEYQRLQQSKAVLIARELSKYPLLIKIASALYVIASKIYLMFKRS